MTFNLSTIESWANAADAFVDNIAPLVATVFPLATPIKAMVDTADKLLDEVITEAQTLGVTGTGTTSATAAAALASATASKAQLATAVAVNAAAVAAMPAAAVNAVTAAVAASPTT
jgi:hypothetical protein